MNRLRYAAEAVLVCAAFALLFCCTVAKGQTTTITALQQQWGGIWLTQGTVSLIPVTPDGNPQSFSANGKFYPPASRNNFNSGFTGTVVKGALTANITVPDKTSVAASYPLCYDVQLRNDLTGQVADIGVRCDITGTTVSLDNYVPPVVAPGYVVGYSHGVLAALPANCAAGAQYGADDKDALYYCGLDGVFHALSGSTNTSTGSGVLADTAAANTYWQLSVASGRLTLAAATSSSGATSSTSFVDSVTGTTHTLTVVSGRLTVN